jgi:hypothetical protein
MEIRSISLSAAYTVTVVTTTVWSLPRTGALLTYQVPTPREGGIWAPSGPAIDAQGNLFVTVGNGSITQGNWDHSDSVLRLSPTLQLEDAFAPQSWQSDNASDLDLSSLGPVLLPNDLLFAHGKSEQGYLLLALTEEPL